MSGQYRRWKPMDVAFGDTIQAPRRLILEIHPPRSNESCAHYTTLSESHGVSYSHTDHSLMTLDEWLVWVEKFREDEPGRVIREAKENAFDRFVESKEWGEFRLRYALTGNAFLN